MKIKFLVIATVLFLATPVCAAETWVLPKLRQEFNQKIDEDRAKIAVLTAQNEELTKQVQDLLVRVKRLEKGIPGGQVPK
ncbi:MAG: hypothetical protein A2521_05085 [Deltaproteobacteria bacterium RIFOXYD12_FULL_57_12]|nr:MAG: hypothetical protein A2521_05085 [Deltaproteobacteria bacterium RIFOXYD12_FULL_57_12]